ncbi:MAG TPA: nitrilase-related carbon-nitrogen hydrolase, partial [Tepidisphaeraceae bacterium]|nr:nitrilase-related carbon-nitrogen hydrolase [Tepidisphaeraceae bacterium]
MQIAAVQFDIAWQNPQANRETVAQMLRSARHLEAGALIVLPEMFSTGFTMDVSAATREHEQTLDFLKTLSRQHAAYVLAGLAAPASEGRARNQLIVTCPGGDVVATYTKLHPFTLGGEHEHFVPGQSIIAFTCNDFTVAPFICYDLRFPEVFRAAVRRYRANLFIVIANWPLSRVEHWIALLRARAIENQAYVLGVNRCGRDPNLQYPGRS